MGTDGKQRQPPDLPGVYLFRDATGAVLYVGKAVSLSRRVGTYFRQGVAAKERAVVRRAAGLEWRTTSTEMEALVLEAELIGHHRPPFNVRLREERRHPYPYLRLDLRSAWPRLELVRRFHRDGALYGGPFPYNGELQRAMDALLQAFPYRSCSDRRLAASRDCLPRPIGRCLGTCVGACRPEEYRDVIDRLVHRLPGRGGRSLRRRERDMRAAAGRQDFEAAARLRDALHVLRRVGVQASAVAGPGFST